MKQLCLISTIFITVLSVSAQGLGDSIIVYIDNRVELLVAIPDYENLKSSNLAPEALEQFIQLLPDLESQLSTTTAEEVTFSTSGTLTVVSGEEKVTYLIKDGRASNTGTRDKAIIQGDGFTMFINTTDLNQLSELPMVACLNQVIQLLPEKSRMSRSLYYQCVDNQVVVLENKHRTNGQLDHLEINFGAGAGLIRNDWAADLTVQLGLGLVKKGVTQLSPYLSSNLIFEFNENNNIDLNLFLNVGFHPNIFKNPKKSSSLGVELGYLVVNQGNLFEDTTFKLGLNWSPLKGVFVGPQLYATDNFNKVFPGIRLGFGI